MSEKIGVVQPYTPEEIHKLCQKDERLFQSMAAMARRSGELKNELKRMQMFLYTAIKQNGAIIVTAPDMLAFREGFTAFTFDKGKTEGSFVFDIERAPIAQEAPAPDGVEDNKPIAQ